MYVGLKSVTTDIHEAMQNYLALCPVQLTVHHNTTATATVEGYTFLRDIDGNWWMKDKDPDAVNLTMFNRLERVWKAHIDPLV